MDRHVFVVGAYLPNGGTFMAYHLARILHLDFGFAAKVVTVQGETPDNGVFSYDPIFPTIDLESMLESATEHDILIANPSFSPLSLGMRCPCRKIMYVQGFNTFDVIDPHFDLYVSVSGTVQRFLRSLYGIETRVIPPFIMPPSHVPSWYERPETAVLASLKGHPQRQTFIYDHLVSVLGTEPQDIRIDILPDARCPHPDLMERMGRYRYFLSLSPAEGFGLMPLEAMAMGCLVVGFDAFGGRDYFRPGKNALTTSHGDIAGIVRHLRQAVATPDRSAALAQAGQTDARSALYSQSRFYGDWKSVLALFHHA